MREAASIVRALVVAVAALAALARPAAGQAPAADAPAGKAARGRRSRIATVEGDEDPVTEDQAPKGRRKAAKTRKTRKA